MQHNTVLWGKDIGENWKISLSWFVCHLIETYVCYTSYYQKLSYVIHSTEMIMNLVRKRMYSMEVITDWILIKCLTEQPNLESINTPQSLWKKTFLPPRNAFNDNTKWQRTGHRLYGTSSWTGAHKKRVNKKNILNDEKFFSLSLT